MQTMKQRILEIDGELAYLQQELLLLTQMYPTEDTSEMIAHINCQIAELEVDRMISERDLFQIIESEKSLESDGMDFTEESGEPKNHIENDTVEIESLSNVVDVMTKMSENIDDLKKQIRLMEENETKSQKRILELEHENQQLRLVLNTEFARYDDISNLRSQLRLSEWKNANLEDNIYRVKKKLRRDSEQDQPRDVEFKLVTEPDQSLDLEVEEDPSKTSDNHHWDWKHAVIHSQDENKINEINKSQLHAQTHDHHEKVHKMFDFLDMKLDHVSDQLLKTHVSDPDHPKASMTSMFLKKIMHIGENLKKARGTVKEKDHHVKHKNRLRFLHKTNAIIDHIVAKGVHDF